MADQALRRADELMTELIEIVETARALPMSTSCVLPRERVLDLLDELREVLPPEMDEARTVVAARDRLVKEAQESAAETRQRAVVEADAVLADATHHAEQLLIDAKQQAATVVDGARAEQERLVSATSVHQAAARAATALREDAERFQAQLVDETQAYDIRVRADAERFATDARAEAERYATKLTVDAENYAERTLDELSAVLHRAAATADQGRSALAQRRAGAWLDAPPGAPSEPPAEGADVGRKPPISA